MGTFDELINLAQKASNEKVTVDVEPYRARVLLNERQRYRNDSQISQKDLDLISNRDQREKLTEQIMLMMIIEVGFIMILVLGTFIIPYLNAFDPKPILYYPPIFTTITSILTCIIGYKYLNIIPVNWIKSTLRFILFIGLFIYLNSLSRETHPLQLCNIIIDNTLANIILYTAITVFAKTTILAGFIIHGLYNALNTDKDKNYFKLQQ